MQTVFRVNIEYSVSCDVNFYGNECTIYCESDGIHDTCDIKGQSSCMLG